MDDIVIRIPRKAAQALAEVLEPLANERENPRLGRKYADNPLTTRAIDLLPAWDALSAALSARRFRILRNESPDIRPAADADDLPPAA